MQTKSVNFLSISFVAGLIACSSAYSQRTIAHTYDIPLDGKNLSVEAKQIRKGAETTVKDTLGPQPGKQEPLPKGEIRKLAEKFGLLTPTRTNPHLRFLEGDISFFAEQQLDEDSVKLQFAARKIILEAADQQGVVIDDQGKLSWAAQQIMAALLKERNALKKSKN